MKALEALADLRRWGGPSADTVAHAVAQSAHVLADDAAQLPFQLLGRIVEILSCSAIWSGRAYVFTKTSNNKQVCPEQVCTAL